MLSIVSFVGSCGVKLCERFASLSFVFATYCVLGSGIMCSVVSFCFKMHKESDFDEMAAWLDERVSSTLRQQFSVRWLIFHAAAFCDNAF